MTIAFFKKASKMEKSNQDSFAKTEVSPFTEENPNKNLNTALNSKTHSEDWSRVS